MNNQHKYWKILYLITGMIIVFTCLALNTSAPNFIGPSPVTGQADLGFHEGTFNSEHNNYTSTQIDDNLQFGITRKKNDSAAANQTLFFNVSILSSNRLVNITGINGTLLYCHAEKEGDKCDDNLIDSPAGTSRNMSIFIKNYETNMSIVIGNINPTNYNNRTFVNFGLSNIGNYSEFINSSGFISIIFEFSWNGTGRSAFLNEHTNLTITYNLSDKYGPFYTLESVSKNESEVYQNINVNFSTNWTDDMKLDSYIFSINQGTGFVNSSPISFSESIHNISTNTSRVIAVPGTNVTWKFIANDSSNNINETQVSSFIVQELPSSFPNTGLSSSSSVFEEISVYNNKTIIEINNQSQTTENKPGFADNSISEYVLLVNDIRGIVKTMEDSGIPVTKANYLLERAINSYQNENFEELTDIHQELISLRSSSFEALALINELNNKPNILVGFVIRDFYSEDFASVIAQSNHLKNLSSLDLFVEILKRTGLLFIFTAYILLVIVISLVTRKILGPNFKKSYLNQRINGLVNKHSSLIQDLNNMDKNYKKKVQNKKKELRALKILIKQKKLESHIILRKIK